MRIFDTGATRDQDATKLDYEGFLSPLVLERFAQYMNKHRVQADGSIRDSDNWQRGFPLDVYMKSGFRHFIDWWKAHRQVDFDSVDNEEDAICGVLFNSMGYLHELIKERNEIDDREDLRQLSFLQTKKNPRPTDQGDL